MSNTDIEIVVEDPTAPEADSPAATSVRAADVVVCLLLFALALTLGYDNWRTGAAERVNDSETVAERSDTYQCRCV